MAGRVGSDTVDVNLNRLCVTQKRPSGELHVAFLNLLGPARDVTEHAVNLFQPFQRQRGERARAEPIDGALIPTDRVHLLKFAGEFVALRVDALLASA